MPHQCGAAAWRWPNSRSELCSDVRAALGCTRRSFRPPERKQWVCDVEVTGLPRIPANAANPSVGVRQAIGAATVRERWPDTSSNLASPDFSSYFAPELA